MVQDFVFDVNGNAIEDRVYKYKGENIPFDSIINQRIKSDRQKEFSDEARLQSYQRYTEADEFYENISDAIINNDHKALEKQVLKLIQPFKFDKSGNIIEDQIYSCPLTKNDTIELPAKNFILDREKYGKFVDDEFERPQEEARKADEELLAELGDESSVKREKTRRSRKSNKTKNLHTKTKGLTPDPKPESEETAEIVSIESESSQQQAEQLDTKPDTA